MKVSVIGEILIKITNGMSEQTINVIQITQKICHFIGHQDKHLSNADLFDNYAKTSHAEILAREVFLRFCLI